MTSGYLADKKIEAVQLSLLSVIRCLHTGSLVCSFSVLQTIKQAVAYAYSSAGSLWVPLTTSRKLYVGAQDCHIIPVLAAC